jgi:hypothetical protein
VTRRVRWLLWTAFAALAALMAWSVVNAHLLTQAVWSETGMRRLVIYLIYYGVWTAALRFFPAEVFVRATAGLAALYAFVYCRSAAPAGVVLILLAALALGRAMLRGRDEPVGDLLATAGGLAVLAFIISVTVFVRVNYWWTYAPALLGIIVVQRRDLAAALRRVCSALVSVGKGLQGGGRLAAELTGLMLIAHLLVVLKPDVSADGLAVHLVVPLQTQYFGLWDFNFRHATWAVMPMNGDWLYTAACILGGEPGARLLNFCELLLLCGLLYSVAHVTAGRKAALLAVAAFASSPIVQLLTGSLFVDNAWALFVVASTVALINLRATQDERYGMLAGVLFGAALATKFGSAAYLVPFLALALMLGRKRRLATACLVVIFAAPPYLTAWTKTGNPIFPYFNTVFHSPYYPREALVDHRWRSGMHLTTPWDVTFRTSKYLEAQEGGFGFHYLLLVPIAVLALRHRWPYPAWMAAAMGGCGALLSFSAVSYARYLYPALPLFLIVAACGVSELEGALGAAVFWASQALVALNLYFLPASGWYHKDFYLGHLLTLKDVRRYVEAQAPGRLLVPALNQRATGQPVAFLGCAEYAGLHANAYTDLWHHDAFHRRLQRADGAVAILRVMNELGIHWFVVRASRLDWWNRKTIEQFLARHTQIEMRAGDAELRRTLPEYEGPEGTDLATTLSLQEVTDDADDRVTYVGWWYRDRQFKSAWNSTLTYSNHPGDSIRVRFGGPEIRYVYTRAFNRGIAEIRIDGKWKGNVDQYSREVMWQQAAVFADLGGGVHELIVRVLPQKNPASSGYFVDADAFVVP